MLNNGDVHFSLLLLFICFLLVVVVVVFVLWRVPAGVIGVRVMLIMSFRACCAGFTNEAFVCNLFYNRNF